MALANTIETTGGIFHLDRLPADVPAESANLRDGISGQIAD